MNRKLFVCVVFLLVSMSAFGKANKQGYHTTIYSWICIDSSGPARQTTGCAYDSDRDRVVLFGGEDTTGILEDTWEWDRTQWVQVATTGPLKRASILLCYDEARANVLLFGGWTPSDDYLGDTWVWNGSIWLEKIVSGPSPRANYAIAYDKQRQRIVLFGGSLWQQIFGDTWEWDGDNWELRSTSGPCPRIFPRMVYDNARHKCILFGGETHYVGQTLNDTWEWDGSSWVQVDTGGPPARLWHMMAYDPIRDRTVLFGGVDGFYPNMNYDDTWEWDGISWTQIPVTGPSGRAAGAMFFHDTLGKVVLYGGTNNVLGHSGFFNDMWIYPALCRGDANGDGVIDVGDVVYLINYLFKGGPAPDPLEAGDANFDGVVDVGDVVYLINYLFKNGPQPCG